MCIRQEARSWWFRRGWFGRGSVEAYDYTPLHRGAMVEAYNHTPLHRGAMVEAYNHTPLRG